MQLWLKLTFSKEKTEANQAKGEISRYRTGKDEAAKEEQRDIAADKPDNAASTRPHSAREGANWNSSASSQSVNIAT
jgi:hypothetical protein